MKVDVVLLPGKQLHMVLYVRRVNVTLQNELEVEHISGQVHLVEVDLAHLGIPQHSGCLRFASGLLDVKDRRDLQRRVEPKSDRCILLHFWLLEFEILCFLELFRFASHSLERGLLLHKVHHELQEVIFVSFEDFVSSALDLSESLQVFLLVRLANQVVVDDFFGFILFHSLAAWTSVVPTAKATLSILKFESTFSVAKSAASTSMPSSKAHVISKLSVHIKDISVEQRHQIFLLSFHLSFQVFQLSLNGLLTFKFIHVSSRSELAEVTFLHFKHTSFAKRVHSRIIPSTSFFLKVVLKVIGEPASRLQLLLFVFKLRLQLRSEVCSC